MLKRHEVQRLRAAGHTQAEVARLAQVSLRSVKRIDREAPVAVADDRAARVARRIGRPPKAERFRKLVEEVLAKEPHLLGVELFRRARAAGYSGGKSALYELVRQVRPQREAKPLVRFEGVAGEFSQHDFGEVDVTFADGSVERIHFFASRLKYSRFVQVTVTPDQRVESLLRALLGHFEGFGGIPLLAVFDRPKTIALRWRDDGTVVEWNPSFGAFALELGIGVELCWPHAPQQKGAVENLVGWVKGSFFKQRRFLDHEDLNRQLAEWLREVNEERPSRATSVIPAVRLEEERQRLRPLKLRAEELALRVPVVVGPTAMVTHDGHQYSMPPDAIGVAGTLHLYQHKVRIVCGKHVAEHPRLFEKSARSVLPGHLASHVAAVSGERARRYLQRQHVMELGPTAHAYVTELVHRRQRAWMRDIEALHELLQAHGAAAVRAAIACALQREVYGAEYVRHFIQPELPLEDAS